MANEHWLISFKCPAQSSGELWDRLRSETLTPSLCSTSIFNIDQQFKSGSLDTLVALADDLSKLDHQLEATLRKVERQYTDIDQNPQLLISISHRGAQEQLTPASYLADFHWDISKYPPSKTLAELSVLIDERLRGLDDDIKSQSAKYVEARNALSQVSKKESGGLSNKDLSEVLTPAVCSYDDFLNTEYIKTLLVVVPKKDIQAWLNGYEFLSTRVVPQSTKQFNIDDKEGLTLWRVVVLKIGQEEFVANAKKNRWAVREFEFNPEKSEIDKKDKERLKTEFTQVQNAMILRCKGIFSELYIALVHVKAMRVYTESILRYSLPPQFFSVSVTPKDGKQKRILDGLIKRYLKPGEKAEMYCSKEESEDGEDFFPFVFLRMPSY